ncbi:S8/S53 family peptidase [Taibaiella soli]|uniref:Peptidase S8 n=1 Tax=Taibaiella soli TaxID=1649169 RepID=A0A2W2AIP4_9BACT|nr:S8/S53 family peptidase [Taibaiella soli]PZF72110.1 hypothetical protein DN068_14340 [Taibaiella soli]
MKKLYSLLLLSCLSAPVWAQNQQGNTPKLSPVARQYMLELKKSGNTGEIMPGYVYRKMANGQTCVSALIKVSDAAMANDNLKNIGVYIGTKAGDIWTVQVPVEKMAPFTITPGVSYIQLDEPIRPNLDVARKTTRVDSVQGGYNLPMGYSGKDVVMGVIDFGFDYTHPTFYDTLGTRYRIQRVWELDGTGTPPPGYAYGREDRDTNSIRQHGTDNPHQMHGTSVTGIAAGSGFGSATNSRFRGMAYDADIVLVGVRRDSIGGQWMQGSFTDFIDGVSYIYRYADSVHKPAVVNISWGSHSGAHDGTSLFNQACDNMTGAGKLLVMSAGNEGQENIHLSKTFTATDTTISTFLTFTPTTYQRTWVDVWGEPGKTFCGEVTLYKNGVAGNTTQFVCIDDNIHDTMLIGSAGNDTCTVQFITSSAEPNGKPRMTINLFNKTADSVGVSLKGTSGTINAWDEYYYYGFPHGFQSAFDSLGKPWATTGNTITTVSEMGAAQSVLLVGAYASKITFTDINNQHRSYANYVPANRLVPFSSHGPMIDGRIKPDITAPGLTLATSVTSFDTSYTPTGSNSDNVVSEYVQPGTGKKYYYAEFIGTSASSPAAAGIVALLLQANPALTPTQLKTVLFSTAIVDNYTGAIPPTGNNNWGHGKINAYAAIKQVIQDAGVYNFQGKKLDCVLFPNPNEGVFTLDYTGNRSEKLNIAVYNISGSLVTSQEWSVSSGQNQKELNLSNLAKGYYVVKLMSATGSVSIKTLVK